MLKWKKMLTSFVLTAAVLLGTSVTGTAAVTSEETFRREWEKVKDDWTLVSLSPGTDETQMNFAWYSRDGEAVSFRYGTKADLSDAKTVEIRQSAAQKGYKSNKVTLKKLKPGTTYYYQADRKETARFRTNDRGDAFEFIYVGDPQIGKSSSIKAEKYGDVTEAFLKAQRKAVRNDAYGWNSTLEAAWEKSGRDADFILSAGDQIQTKARKLKDTTVSEIEYTGYLCPKLLKSLPVATTVGSHDDDNPNYDYHFNVPNQSVLGANDYVGGDYWFTYGSALFLMLNTQDSDTEEHKEFIEEAIRKNPECTWRIVTMHQDIYGSAKHSVSDEILSLRRKMVPYFDANDIDVVLTGHDHSYTRSKFLRGDKVVETRIRNGTVTNPDGILYMTANSSSGSKYYKLLPEKQPYVAARWQGKVPTYSIVKVTKDTFSIRTYRTDNGKKIDDALTIRKESGDRDLANASVNAVGDQPYTGKDVKPSLTVRMNGTVLRKGTDYTVHFSDHRKIGTAHATITGTGAYTGTKSISFRIVPAKIKILSAVSERKGEASVKYKKADGGLTGYQVICSRDKEFRSYHSKKTTKLKTTFQSLKKGKNYYVKVRGYKKTAGKTYYGEYSRVMQVKIRE